mgnify:CR=1 FL=1
MKNILDTIGNTPIVKLQKIVPKGSGDVYVKLEAYNPTGSKKDRMALAMIQGAEKKGFLTRGMSVVEYSGGSTGAGLAFVCGIKGYQFRLITADVFGKEKIGLMKALGADLEIIKSDNGKITKELITKMISRAAEISNESNTFFTDQLNNYDIIDVVKRRLKQNDRLGYLEAYKVFSMREIKNGPLPIKCPTLIVTGQFDAGSTPEMAIKLGDAIKFSNVEVLEGILHMSPIEGSEKFNKMLFGFLMKSYNVQLIDCL